MKTNYIGQKVKLLADLLDLKGNPHPYAGKKVTILNKTRKTYLADPGDGTTTVFFDGDFAVSTSQVNDYIHAAGTNSEIITVPTSMLVESPFNPRKTFDAAALATLTDSAKQVGIMQPLLVRPAAVPGGNAPYIRMGYEIVFGHRRFRAAIAAGLLQVPVMVRNLTNEQSSRLQAIENLQREDLNPIEEAQGYADYCRDHKVTKQQLADHIGVSRTTVYNQLKLLELLPAGQILVQRGLLGTELAMEVARIGGPEVQAPVLSKIFHGTDLSTVTADTKAMSTRQGIKLIEAIGKNLQVQLHESIAESGKSPNTKVATAKSIANILIRLRAQRDQACTSTDFDLRNAFNAACDRLDVLHSTLVQKG